MSFLRLIPILLMAPAFILGANPDLNYKITLDKFKVGIKMETTADKIINIDEKTLSIQPGFPLKENTIYLRQKKGAKEYKWFAGSLNVEKFKKVHAFNLAENRLKVGEVVMTRFYSMSNAKAFQDETDIYFDRKFIYSTRLPKLYFFKNGQWQVLKESVPPSVIRLDIPDDNTEVFSDDMNIKPGTKYIYPVDPGHYTMVFMKDNYMPYAIIIMTRPATEYVVTPHLMRADISKESAPKLSITKDSVIAAKNLLETEAIYDKYMEEMRTKVKISDSSDFYKFYPPQQNPDVVNLSPRDEEYLLYANRYKIKRNEAYEMWRQGQMNAVFEIGKLIQHKLDSLQALENRMYVWPITVNPVYAMAVPEYSADLMPASVQIPIPQDTLATQDSMVKPTVPEVQRVAEKLELVFGNEGDRYEFKWIGNAIGIESETLIALIRSGKANMIITLQNDKPLWVIQDERVVSRHHYRYVNMEIEFNGQLYSTKGQFVLPDYILNTEEVQDWLHPKPKAIPMPIPRTSSSEMIPIVESSSSSVPELIVIPPPSSSEDNRIIKDPIRGDVIMIDSGSFRYKGHVVNMSGFAIHATEVTQKFFNDVMKRRDSTDRVIDRSKFKGDKKPVHNITWSVAKDFCVQLGGDLPSEAQWEFAGRAENNEGAMWMLDDVLNPSAYATYKENSYKLGKKDKDYGPHDVASRKPNAWGIYDMSGNVAEWTRDKHFPISFWMEKNNPTGSMFGFLKVFKGGSWKDAEKDLNLVRSDNEDPRYWSDGIGFRCMFTKDKILKTNGK